MNYFDLHIGDYEKATAHLTACEDGIYGRLLRRYYDTELPLTLDVKALQRFVRARTEEEQAALQIVLEEFFHQEDDGWHHQRCDREIAKYLETEPDREARKDNDRERQRRTRDRRKSLFEQLRSHDIVPPFDTKTSALEALLSRVTSHGESHGRPQAVTLDDSVTSHGESHGRPQVVTCDNTATQTPIPNPQSPDTNIKREREAPRRASRLPAGWSLTPEMVDWARHERPDLDPFKTLERFRDYWTAKAGKDGAKLDWAATWRNWVRAEKAQQQGRQNGHSGDIFGGGQ